MLEHLKVKDVGPAPEMELELAPRLNIITGDNGLGKSFLLDVAWWALTGNWAGLPALPSREEGTKPSISFRARGGSDLSTSDFDFSTQAWPAPQWRSLVRSLVIYARVDGSFSVMDPKRLADYRHSPKPLVRELRQADFHFTNKNVWDGLESDGKILCNGLIRDWTTWQVGSNPIFSLLTQVLSCLSPSSEEVLRPGKPMRVSVDDARDIPTLSLPYGIVPVTHASAGMRRTLAFAYILIWAWNEHCIAASMHKEDPTQQIVFIIDEVEAHLHPKWQRSILPSLLDLMRVLNQKVNVQLLIATQSPLILASIEPLFDEERDTVFHLDLHGSQVTLHPMPWAKQGDVTGWLVSEIFGLKQARSLDAERAIEAAEAWMRGDTGALPSELDTKDKIHAELMHVLAGHDPFWPRWIVWVEQHQGQ